MPERPNVLFICSDQQRWDTLGQCSPEKLRTPTFDRLLSEGVHLPRAFCNSPVWFSMMANV